MPQFLPVHLIEFRIDIRNGVVEPRDDDVLDGVHSSIRGLDHFIQDHESGLCESCERQSSREEDVTVDCGNGAHLQRGKLHESAHGLDICFPASLHLLTTSTETRQVEVLRILHQYTDGCSP